MGERGVAACLPTVVLQHCKDPPPASLAPLMCHGRAALFCLSFSSTPLLPLLTEVSSLYCTVQKQNHKPISVILAMRLDGAQFVSLRGNRIHSSVPQKTPFSRTERELSVRRQLPLRLCASCDSLRLRFPVLGDDGTPPASQAKLRCVCASRRLQQNNQSVRWSAFLTELPLPPKN